MSLLSPPGCRLLKPKMNTVNFRCLLMSIADTTAHLNRKHITLEIAKYRKVCSNMRTLSIVAKCELITPSKNKLAIQYQQDNCSFYSTKKQNEPYKMSFVKNELKEKLRDTEARIMKKSNIILQDIKETRDKVKEKVGDIIEKENIYTIPNLLCISRILLSPYLGLLIIQANFDFALAVLGVAAVTDLLDGWIARTWASQSSKMGSFLDPMADKVLIATLFLSLTYADLIPIALTGLIVTRDVLLVTAGFVIRYKSLPPPRTLSRYFDVTHATAQLAPTFISKVNTGVQLLLVGTTLAAPVFHYVGHPALECLWYVTAVTTVAGGISYLVSKNTYKFLKKM